MKTQNGLILFLLETIQRFFTKSPKYFVILQWLSLIAMAITGLPELLQQWGLVLPPFLTFLSSVTATKIALAILAISKMTTQSSTVAVQKDGIGVKVTDAAALPFTAQAEQKKADTVDLPTINNIKK